MLQPLRQSKYNKQKGMAALALMMMILAVITIITMFSSRIIITDNKIYKNQKNNLDAFNAAQAGMDYALGYLNASTTNIAAVTTALSNCAATTNTVCLTAGGSPLACTTPAQTSMLANNARYTMKYGCIANNMTFLTIASTGESFDGSATRSIHETVMRYGGAVGAPFISQGKITMNNGILNNSLSGATIVVDTGATINPYNNGTLKLNGVSVCTSALYRMNRCDGSGTGGSGVKNNDTALAALSATALQTMYLGKTIAGFSTGAAIHLTCTSNAVISENSNGGCTPATPHISGTSGSTIFIAGNGSGVTFQGSFKLGTATALSTIVFQNPGALNFNNGIELYSNIYTDNGQITLNGNVFHQGTIFSSSTSTPSIAYQNALNITGGLIAGQGGLLINSSGTIQYAPAGGGTQYGIVSGSWRDFN